MRYQQKSDQLRAAKALMDEAKVRILRALKDEPAYALDRREMVKSLNELMAHCEHLEAVFKGAVNGD